MSSVEPSPSTRRLSWRGRLIGGVAIAAMVALAGVLVRELLPHHAAVHSATGRSEPSAVAAANPPTPAATTAPSSKATPAARRAARAAATTASGSHIPLAASVIAEVAADPESFAPSHTFAPPAGRDQVFNYEPLPPFNSTTLKRTRTNPAAWELDAMHGPTLKDLGPEGAVRQAALVRDAVGNETPWYAIDAGPLAPAFAVMQGNALRVMSRAFMIENRATLPADVAAALGK